MANLALNGTVHGAALNGKILFDNSVNWQDLGTLTISDTSGYESDTTLIDAHMLTKIDENGAVHFTGYLNFSNLDNSLQTEIDLWKMPSGYPENISAQMITNWSSGMNSLKNNAFVIRGMTVSDNWPNMADVVDSVGIKDGRMFYTSNTVPDRPGLVFFNDVVISGK